MMTAKEAVHIIFLTITEINKKLRRCKSKTGKNRTIKEVCNRNDVSEKHIRKIGGYDR
jgi:anaerobic ribonucleoside-triphosphate reductase